MTRKERLMKTLCLALIALLSTSFASAGRVEKAASRMSLDQLFAVQTLLRVKLDGQAVCEDEFSGLSEIAVSSMPQLLQAEVQAKLDAMKANGTLIPYLSDPARQASCAARCRCDLYDLALAKSEKRTPLKPARFLKCAKANEFWICKNGLFRALITETKKATE